MSEVAIRAEAARDLRTQLSELSREDEPTVLFQEWSPGRKLVSLWSMQDGQEIRIPQYMVGPAIMKRANGQWLFTAQKELAPAVQEGRVPCFLAANSPERESGLLAQAGLDHLQPCLAQHLRSNYSKRTHAENRHKQSWAILQDYLAEQAENEAKADRRQQTEAMLAMAEQAGVSVRGAKAAKAPKEPVESTEFICDECGKACASAFGLKAHQRSHAKAIADMS